MSNIKSLILGSAASVVAFAGAQAADLPVKAKAVQYVKICSLYGAGFYYIPGTETCLKIGGYVRAEAEFGLSGGSNAARWNADDGLRTRNGDNFYTRGRVNVSFDTRTATEYGVVRAFYLHDILFGTASGDYSPSTNSVNSAQWGGQIIANAFIQFAGFTFGKTVPVQQPQFAMPVTGAGLIGFQDYSAPNSGELSAYYTAELGNGLSVSFGIADQTYGRNPIYDSTLAIQTPFTTSTGFGGSVYGGQVAPDFVANVKFDQAWGGIFGSVRVRDMSMTYYSSIANAATGAIESNNHAPDVVAFAASAGFQLKNLPTGPGDTFTVLGAYGDGITGITGNAIPESSLIGLRGIDKAPGSLGVGYILDGVTNAATGTIQKTKAYGVQVGFEHFWVPGRLRTSLFGAYQNIDYNGTANALLTAAAIRATTGGGIGLVLANGATVGNFDVRISQIGSRSVWTPVPGLDLTAEVLYSHLDLPLAGTITNAGPVQNFQAIGTTATLGSQNTLTGMLRAQRVF